MLRILDTMHFNLDNDLVAHFLFLHSCSRGGKARYNMLTLLQLFREPLQNSEVVCFVTLMAPSSSTRASGLMKR
jgi:hypothetical protein